ncbi:flagellar basal body L-ring protein FlgH [Halioxenophilus sp. WMMB6]|uniref:flagellar basal body L-ring protein FlgH n=1 Tax=Halioxenophilus sp. WMMB6 TaxID=3073815 RepID=UPI00295E8D83|nr:flagellar basal body L-ring protein FlgH [Halioxenophilus sp. WMMB6]
MLAEWVKLLAMVQAACLLAACGSQTLAPKPDSDPYFAPVMAPSAAREPPSNGSLYSRNYAMSLYGDSKAMRVGDIITVVLQERTTSSKSTNVSVIKDNNIGVDEGTLLGTGLGVSNLSLLTDLTAQRDFSGEADADQSNRLQGNITVTVADILENGNLVIRGEKWLTLNRGDEFIRLSGIVRPQDIATDNTIASTRIANARISYSGTGELAESNRMGWLSRFFNSALWPF